MWGRKWSLFVMMSGLSVVMRDCCVLFFLVHIPTSTDIHSFLFFLFSSFSSRLQQVEVPFQDVFTAQKMVSRRGVIH